MKSRIRATMTAIHLAVAIIIPPAAVLVMKPHQAAAMTVFDPSNYVENLLTEINTIEMISNQVQQITNQLQSLENEAKHLQGQGDMSAVNQMADSLDQMNSLMGRAEAIQWEVDQSETDFGNLYTTTQDGTTWDTVTAARNQYKATMANYQAAVRTQSRVVSNLSSDMGVLQNLNSASQAAPGMLAATQINTQAQTMTAKQLMQIQALMAQQFRSQAMEQAKQQQAAERSRYLWKKAATKTGSTYTPSTVAIQWNNTADTTMPPPAGTYTPGTQPWEVE